jgi:hypothetical protein
MEDEVYLRRHVLDSELGIEADVRQRVLKIGSGRRSISTSGNIAI